MRFYPSAPELVGGRFLPETEALRYDLDDGRIAYGWNAASQYLKAGGEWVKECRSGRVYSA